MAMGSAAADITVVGAFNDRQAGTQAMEALQRAGFPRDAIGFASRTAEGEAEYDGAEESKAEEGALAGAAIGAGVGGMIGLGVLSGFIPVVGPAIAAGTLGTILSNVAGGAAVAGLTGALTGWGMSDSEATHYENEFAEGRTLVSVRAGARAAEARRILDEFGASQAPMAANKRK